LVLDASRAVAIAEIFKYCSPDIIETFAYLFSHRTDCLHDIFSACALSSKPPQHFH